MTTSNHVTRSTFGACPPTRPMRFYFYGLQGFFYEVLFTCLYELFTKGNVKLYGYTSLYSFFIYGSCVLATEHVYLKLRNKTTLFQRLLVYVPIVYLWEYSTGYLLTMFGACPWNYTQYEYNVHGLITLEYLPGWAILAVFSDYVYKYMLRIQPDHSEKSA